MIFKSFLFSVLVIIIGCALIPVPDILASSAKTNQQQAYMYLLLCALAVIIGYFAPPLIRRTKKVHNRSDIAVSCDEIPTRHMLLLAIVATIGFIIYIIQINETVGVVQYFQVLLSANSSDVTNVLRAATMTLSSADGGLPGIIKVFEENTVIAAFCVLALLARGYRIKTRVNIALAAIICAMFIAGTILRIDRLSLLALGPVSFSLIRQTKSRYGRLIALSCTLLLVVLMAVQSVRRGSEISLIGWVGLYLNLGMLNLGLLINTLNQHTYGLAGVFSFVAWLFRGANMHILPSTTYEFVFNPAQNGFGYMFLDFGWCGVILFVLGGHIGRVVDNRVDAQGYKGGQWPEIQWIVAYAILSLPTVPAYSGMEFWLLLLLSVILVKYITKRTGNNRQSKSSRARAYTVTSAVHIAPL